MKHKRFENLNPFKINSVYKLFILICIPAFFTSIFSYLSNSFHVKNYKSMLTSVYSNELNRFLKSTDDEIIKLTSTASLMNVNKEIQYALTTNLPLNMLDKQQIFAIRVTLQKLPSQMSFVDSILIVNRKSGFVVSSSGVYDLNKYFNDVYSYKDYPTSFWREYNSTKNSTKILSPSYVTTAEPLKPKPITPVVYTTSGSDSFNNIIVFNISMEKVLDNFKRHRFTENSKIFLINNLTHDCISEEKTPIDLPVESIVSNVNTSDTNYYRGDIKIDKTKHIIFSSQKHSSIFGYTYIVAIPYSDINNYTNALQFNVLVFSVLFIIMLFIYSIFGAKHLYQPWKLLAKKLSFDSDQSSSYNIITYVNKAITEILDKNANLTHLLNVHLPLSQQKYLIDILNNHSDGKNDEMNKTIFKYDYFISIAINISIHPSYAINLNPQLYADVYTAIEYVFSSTFITFSLPNTTNSLYLLLNVESDNCYDKINLKIEEVKQLFAADANDITIFVGTGHIYKGIDGLKTTHQEAISSIYNQMNSEKVKLYENNMPEYTFNINSENILQNYLIAGYREKATEFVENIFKSCKTNSFEGRQQVYMSLISALYRIIRLKKVPHMNFDAKTELDVLNDILSRSEESIQTYIISLVNTISDHIASTGKKIDISEVLDYINEHYTEDLYLDRLAEMFHTTPKYLSKLFSQEVKIPFKDYLTQLRISKAQKILETQDIKINDLVSLVGFYNRSTFIRAFKNKVGITPSEYRALYAKNKQ